VRIRFLVLARTELSEAIAYYNEQRSGLGFRFSDEVKRTIKRIVQYPRAWPRLSKSTRHSQVNGFPYSVIYYPRNDELVIVGVMHSSREPGNWEERLRDA
jgi:plasmid stabilization system protein ParE